VKLNRRNLAHRACQNARNEKWHARNGSPMRAKIQELKNDPHETARQCVPKCKK